MSEALLRRVQRLRANVRHGRFSPHKPLLLLLSIGRHLNGDDGLARFTDIEEELNKLIKRFGLPGSRPNAHLPFWHLQNDDGLWRLDRPEAVLLTSKGGPLSTSLRRNEIQGSLTPEFQRALEDDPFFAWRVVDWLLETYFPPSLHEDILIEVRLVGNLGVNASGWAMLRAEREGRDWRFREAVLNAYDNLCALCAMEVRLYERPIGVEAAHIQWHMCDGPPDVPNGIAFCALHHKFFDQGLFTIRRNLTVMAGSKAQGASVPDLLQQYDNLALTVIPDQPSLRPAPKYLKWHREAVFKG